MQKSFLRETAGAVMKAVVIVLTVVIVVMSLSAFYEEESGISDGMCNVAVLPVEGTILPFHGIGDFELIVTPETIENFMDAAEKDNSIQAVLVEINSPGGTPVASQRIAERFRSSDLPIVGLIGDLGASGGYMVAAATDLLIASPMSTVGSIGVNRSYVEESEKNEEEGLTYVQLIAGKYKDAGSPDRAITDEERALLQSDLDLVHDIFIDLVAEYRGMDRNAVEAVADGSTMLGVTAKEASLVDRLGGRAEARDALATILEIDNKDVVFCEYDSGFSLF
jgi:protease-4